MAQELPPFEHRLIFLSHSHADRRLANALGELVSTVFSGLLDVYASSDPSPAGGLQPGDDWYVALHTHLARAESAWVLATPTSMSHPWIYWEAGIARASCPRGVLVLRAGVDVTAVPSPLNALQSYDALSRGDDGFAVMLRKVAHQVGMTLDEGLLERAVESWLSVAASHEPRSGDLGRPVTPEQVDRIERLLSRMESLTVGTASLPKFPPLELPPDAFKAGDRVTHGTFGEGVVVGATPAPGDVQYTVAFADKGVRRMMQSFARMRLVPPSSTPERELEPPR